jgi:hypothetical protein
MKTRKMVLSVAAVFAAALVCFAAADANLGTWKLNEAKSKFAAGATKNQMVSYTADGDNVKVTVDGVTADGKKVHSEWSGKFDDKDYPVTGDPTSDTRAYKRVNASTLAMTLKKDGKVTATGQIVVSSDGKTRTVTTKGTDAMGKTVTSRAVYDKQ